MEQKVRKLEDFNAEDRIDLKLLENNTYFLNGEICEESVGACAKWLICENLEVSKENDICNDKMINILKEATGLAPSVIKKKLLPPSDVYLTAQEVLDIGIADHILE